MQHVYDSARSCPQLRALQRSEHSSSIKLGEDFSTHLNHLLLRHALHRPYSRRRPRSGSRRATFCCCLDRMPRRLCWFWGSPHLPQEYVCTLLCALVLIYVAGSCAGQSTTDAVFGPGSCDIIAHASTVGNPAVCGTTFTNGVTVGAYGDV
jgi:hypothetical protein